MKGRPKLICMDGTTMGLSPAFVDRVLEQNQTINQQGTTIYMVEQNANLALEVSHYGYVLETGRILLHDHSSALRANEKVKTAYLGGG